MAIYTGRQNMTVGFFDDVQSLLKDALQQRGTQTVRNQATQRPRVTITDQNNMQRTAADLVNAERQAQEAMRQGMGQAMSTTQDTEKIWKFVGVGALILLIILVFKAKK